MKKYGLIFLSLALLVVSGVETALAQTAAPWYIESYTSSAGGWQRLSSTDRFANSMDCIQSLEFIVMGKYGGGASTDPLADQAALKKLRCVNSSNFSEVVFSPSIAQTSVESQNTSPLTSPPPEPYIAPSTPSGFTALAPVPGLTDTANTSLVNSASLTTFFNNLYKYLIGLASTLAIGIIIYEGIKIAYSQENISSIINSKGRIAQALTGLGLILSPVVVFSIINPSILNLSVALPPLDTATPKTVVSGTSPTSGIAKLSPTQQAACIGYSAFKTIRVPMNKYCKDVLGDDWARVDDVCAQTRPSSDIDPACTGADAFKCHVCGLKGTTQEAQTGCVTKHTGPYLETAVCASGHFAQRYSCKNELRLVLPGCQNQNPNTGACEDTGVTVHCSGKTLSLVSYSATYVFGVITGWSTTIPRDVPAENAFTAGCRADGGVVKKTYPALNGTECPSDGGIPNYKTSDQSGVTCDILLLSCESK